MSSLHGCILTSLSLNFLSKIFTCVFSNQLWILFSRGKNNILLAALICKILFSHSKIKFISSHHHVISSMYIYIIFYLLIDFYCSILIFILSTGLWMRVSIGTFVKGLLKEQVLLSHLKSNLIGRFLLVFAWSRVQSGISSKSLLYANFLFCLSFFMVIQSFVTKKKKPK